MDKLSSVNGVFGLMLEYLSPHDRAMVAFINPEWRQGVKDSLQPVAGLVAKGTFLDPTPNMATRARMTSGERMGMRVPPLTVLTSAYFAAREESDTSVSAWLRVKGCPWDCRTAWGFASSHNVEGLLWALRQGCPTGGPVHRGIIRRPRMDGVAGFTVVQKQWVAAAAIGDIEALQTLAVEHAPSGQFVEIFDAELREIVLKTSIANDTVGVFLWLQAHKCRGIGLDYEEREWTTMSRKTRQWIVDSCVYFGENTHLEIFDWMRYAMTDGGPITLPDAVDQKRFAVRSLTSQAWSRFEAVSQSLVLPYRMFNNAQGKTRMQFVEHGSLNLGQLGRGLYGMSNIHQRVFF